jgi:hypothetical protein
LAEVLDGVMKKEEDKKFLAALSAVFYWKKRVGKAL